MRCQASVEEVQAAQPPTSPAEPLAPPPVQPPLGAVPPLTENGQARGVARTIEVDVSDTSDTEDDSLKITNIALSPQTIGVCLYCGLTNQFLFAQAFKIVLLKYLLRNVRMLDRKWC